MNYSRLGTYEYCRETNLVWKRGNFELPGELEKIAACMAVEADLASDGLVTVWRLP